MNTKKSPDMWLFSLTIALLVIGVFMVFDASYGRAGQVKYTGGDSFYFLKRQAAYALAGIVMMFLAMHVRYWKLRRLGLILLLLSIVALALVFVPGFGILVNGARRWIRIGPITIQPSEFAKLGLIVYLAALLSAKRRDIRDWKRGLLPALAPLAPIGMLTMAQPDMGTTIVLTATALAVIYMAGARKRHLTLVLLIGFVLGSALIFTSPYRRERILSFVDPFEDYHGGGYQVCQSLIALGSGGIFGVGVCESREKLFYLPAEHTDFILAVLGEEMGLIGTSSMVVLFLLFGARGFTVAYRTRQDFGRLLAGGISALICGQALLNMYVVTSSVPATGVPLPFISYGGSSLAMNLLCVGILLGVSKYPGPIESYEYEDRVNGGRHRRPRLSGDRYSRSPALSSSRRA